MPNHAFAELPLLRVLLPFLAGTVLFCRYDLSAKYLWVLFTAGLCLSWFLHSVIRLASPIFLFLSFQFTLFLGAGALTRMSSLPEQQDHFSKTRAAYFTGHILKSIEEKERSYKTIVRIDSLIDSTRHIRRASGNLLLYLQKDSLYHSLQIGDKVLFAARYQAVEGPKNPGQFHYKNYLEHQYIFHQAYLRQGELLLQVSADRFPLRRWSQEISTTFQSILYEYIPGHDAAALADGILLGHRADIDTELYNAFAYTGILHILSVSGLHVGIVYALLALLLRIIPDRNRIIRIGKFLLIISCIWLFALITGLGAAVVRSAILFSLLHYGRLSNEHTHNINLLCGAALIQLLIDPMQLYDIGFQLSYLAMLGIFLLTKRIYALYYHPNPFVDWTWQLWSASLAAQLFTLPLSLYYFGNFPTWFLFANIFAIPLSTLILWLSIFLLPLNLIPVAALWLGKLIGMLGSLFIWLTLTVSNLPLGKISGLKVDQYQALLIACAIAGFSIFLLRTKFRVLLLALGLSLLVLGISIFDTVRHWQQDRIILYAVPKQLVIGWNDQDHQTLLYRDSLPAKQFDFCIRGSHRLYHIRRYSALNMNTPIDTSGVLFKDHLLVIKKNTFYILDKSNSRLKYVPPLKVDHLIISGNMYLDVNVVKQNYQFRKILLSPENDNRHLRIYRKLLDQAGIAYKDLSREALIIDL